MTDLRAMSWPERLKWAVENDLGGAELARMLGVSQPAVCYAQRRCGIKLRYKRAESMRRLHADPEFAAAHAERSAERMRRLHADPEFAAANAERMRRLHAEGRIVMHHLAGMTPQQRADYDTLMGKGYTKAEALAALGLGGGA